MSTRPHQPLAIIVGANIIASRQRLGMSQVELARQLGVSPDQLSRIERGIVAPRFNRLEKIAAILQCTVAEFFVSNTELDQLPHAMSRDSEVLYLADRIVKLMRKKTEDSAPDGSTDE